MGVGSEKKCNLAEANYRMCIHLLGLLEQSAINQTQTTEVIVSARRGDAHLESQHLAS